MDERVAVFAPATVANVAAGFDILGFAVAQPGDIVIASRSELPGVQISAIEGDAGKLPLDPVKNTASVAAQALLNSADVKQGVSIEIRKEMPLGSGLGSSSASAVAAVVAVNELLELGLTRRELLPFTLEGERIACGAAHADNVAPALLGGFVLIRSYDPLDIVDLPCPKELWAVVVHPNIEVRTEDARSILKQRIELKDAIKQSGNTAGLIAGLCLGDYELIGRSLSDVLVQPTRALLIPCFHEVVEAAQRSGALGAGISGSGPSIFALCRGTESAEEVSKQMAAVFDAENIEATAFVSPVNTQGACVLNSIP